MVKQIIRLSLFIVLTPLAFMTCEDKLEIKDHGKLTGQVLLENQTDHSNTLIYIEELKRGVLTDSRGKFTFLLGEEDTIHTGVFKLYYFLEDYALQWAQIVLEKGEVIFDSYDVDDSGTLTKVDLKQIIRVEVLTDKKIYAVGDSIEFEIKITNLWNSNVNLQFSNLFGSNLGIKLYSAPDVASFPIGADLPTQREKLAPGEKVITKMVAIIPEGSQWERQYQHMQTSSYMVGFYPYMSYYDGYYQEAIQRSNIRHYSRYAWGKLYNGPIPFGPSLSNKYEFPIIQINNDTPAEDFWVKTSAPNDVSFTDIIIDSEDNIIVSTFWGLIYLSSDGGSSWTIKELTTSRITALVKTVNDELLVSTFEGIYKSVDHGQTWSLSYFDSCQVYGLAYGNNGFLYIGSNCGNYSSADNGENWTEMKLHNDGDRTYIDLYLDFFGLTSNDHLYAADRNWTWGRVRLYYSEDNGSNWYGVDDPHGLCGSAFVVNSQGNAFIGSYQSDECGPDGLWRSNDYGQSWGKVSSARHSLKGSFKDPKGNIYFMGAKGIFYSKNNGDTWERFNDIGLGSKGIQSLALSKDGYFFAAAGSGGIYRSVKPLYE